MMNMKPHHGLTSQVFLGISKDPGEEVENQLDVDFDRCPRAHGWIVFVLVR